MKITFDNILDKVVNSRTLSRKEKHAAINCFLKQHSGECSSANPEEFKVLETLKGIRKTYLLKEKSERNIKL